MANPSEIEASVYAFPLGEGKEKQKLSATTILMYGYRRAETRHLQRVAKRFQTTANINI